MKFPYKQFIPTNYDEIGFNESVVRNLIAIDWDFGDGRIVKQGRTVETVRRAGADELTLFRELGGNEKILDTKIFHTKRDYEKEHGYPMKRELDKNGNVRK